MVGKYSVDGYYIHAGARGEHSGELEFFSDGKILGHLTDEDGTYKLKKLVLGIHYDDGKRINFIKVAPGLGRASDIMPVLWDMHSTSPLSAPYTGHFAFLGNDFPVIGEIERRMHHHVDLGDLAAIKPEILKQVYFNQRILEAAENLSRQRGWMGELVFTEKAESFKNLKFLL